MAIPTAICLASEGLQFSAQHCRGAAFIKRMNQVSDGICEAIKRTNASGAAINAYCPPEDSPSSSESSSSSSEQCQFGCEESTPKNYIYQVDDNLLDMELWDALKDLEDEMCDMFRDLKALELEVAISCPTEPSSSSSSESSSSESSSSSEQSSSSSEGSSSSSESSSSESSSSSEAPTCFPGPVQIKSYCPSLSYLHNVMLYLNPNEDSGYSDCGYLQTPYVEPGSSSSSSSEAPSSSSSSGINSDIKLRYNLSGGYWEIYTEETGMLAYLSTINAYDPRGVYSYTILDCIGQTIQVIS